MKSSHTGLAVVGVLLAGLWYVGGGTDTASQAAAAEQPRVSAPLTHDNLTVYFVHGPDAVAAGKVITLQEALDAGLAVVHETGTVNTLAVENRSDDADLFIQEGDMIKGGKQDRMIAVDMMLPPKSGVVPFPAHCVEQGRWTGRQGDTATKFAKCDNFAVGTKLRYANAAGDQGEVWANVKRNQDNLSKNLATTVNAAASATSLQLALENEAVVAKMNEFEKALREAGEARGDVIGVVFVLNGKVRTAEVYGSNTLFRKVWPKLLRSAAADAVAEKTDKAFPAVPTAGEVEHYLACAGQEPAGTDRGNPEITDGTSNQSFNSNFQGQGNEDFTLNGLNASDNNRTPRSVQTALNGRSGATRNRLVVARGAQPNLPSPEPDLQQAAGQQAAVNPGNALRGLAGNEFNAWAVGNRNDVPAANDVANPAPVAVNNDGNRLTVNRNEDRAGLVTESRDPARKNAVIHRSYIKK